jgi:hypothetical protein
MYLGIEGIEEKLGGDGGRRGWGSKWCREFLYDYTVTSYDFTL